MKSLWVCTLFAMGCGVPYFAVEIDAQEICAVGLEAEMPGVPGSPLQHILGDDFSDLTLIDNLETDVKVLQLSIDVSEVALDNLDGLHVFVLADGLPMAEVAGSDNVAAVEQVITVSADEPMDITDYMLASNMEMALTLSGQLPAETWNTKVDVCFSAAANYHETL